MRNSAFEFREGICLACEHVIQAELKGCGLNEAVVPSKISCELAFTMPSARSEAMQAEFKGWRLLRKPANSFSPRLQGSESRHIASLCVCKVTLDLYAYFPMRKMTLDLYADVRRRPLRVASESRHIAFLRVCKDSKVGI